MEDRIFVLLTVGTLLLLGLAVAFGLATLLLRWRHNRVARLWAGLEARWEPVIHRVLAGDSPPEALTRLVRPREALRFLDFLSRFARRLAGDEVRVLQEVARPFLPHLARGIRRRGAEARARAVQTLGVLGLPEHREVVREAVDDESALVSILAARALSRSGEPDSVALVLDRLDRYELWHPAFLSGLLSEGGLEGAPLLRAALADPSRSDASRTVVANALRDVGDPEAADTACRVLGDEAGPDLTVACLRLLAEMGASRHRGCVLPFVASPHFQVRSYALNALRTVGTGDDLPAFTAALEDGSPWVAMEAARGIRELGGTELLAGLAEGGGPRGELARQVLAE